MPWTKIDDHVANSRKVRKLSHAAFRLWILGLVHCHAELTDGFIDADVLDDFPLTTRERAAAVTELCTEQVRGKAPLWSADEHGYRVHSYLDWNDSREQIENVRRNSRERMARVRANRWANIDGTHGEVTTRSHPTPPHPIEEETGSFAPSKEEPSKGAARKPRGHPAVALWCDLSRSKLGRPVVDVSKVAGQLKALTDQHGLKTIEPAMQQFFAETDPFVVNGGFDIDVFYKRIEQYAMRAVQALRPRRDEWTEQRERNKHLLATDTKETAS